MKFTTKYAWMAAVLTLGAATLPLSARAQETAPPVAAPVSVIRPAEVLQRPVPALKFTQRPLQEITTRLSKATGALVITDSTVSSVAVNFSTVGGSLQSVLAQVVAALPKGATARAVLLPASAPMPEGDAVSAFLAAQDALKSKQDATKVGGSTVALPENQAPVGTLVGLEAFGKPVSDEVASTLSTSLGLTPVILISNPKAALDPVGKMATIQTEGMRYYQSLSPEQKKQFLNQQFDNFFNMTPQDRQAFVGQMMQQGSVMMEKMNAMSPEQKTAFQQEMMQAMKANGIPTGAPAGGK